MSFLDRYKDNKELFESLIPIILNFPPRRFLIFRSPTAVFFVLIWAGLGIISRFKRNLEDFGVQNFEELLDQSTSDLSHPWSILSQRSAVCATDIAEEEDADEAGDADAAAAGL